MDTPKYTLKMPTECDIDKCKLLDSKLSKSNCYTAAKTMYIIDRLANESAETLLDIKPGSYGIDDIGNISYISNSSKQVVNANIQGHSRSLGSQGIHCHRWLSSLGTDFP